MRAVVELSIVGATRNGHTFHVRVEEPFENDTALYRGEYTLMPKLRPCCSCGWRATDKSVYSLEENAHWRWERHVDRSQPRVRS